MSLPAADHKLCPHLQYYQMYRCKAISQHYSHHVYVILLAIFHEQCCRQLRNVLTEEVIRDLAGDTNAIEELESEWRQLCDDRVGMREVNFILSWNELQCVIQLVFP